MGMLFGVSPLFLCRFPFKPWISVMGLLEAVICPNRENAMEDKNYEQYSTERKIHLDDQRSRGLFQYWYKENASLGRRTYQLF
nr:MAG TPA: hypothetical protein [Caudoviricetes sp.]